MNTQIQPCNGLSKTESDRMLCFCQQVDRKTICRAIEQGANSLESICQLTGAGTECGSCRIYIKELLGENLWHAVTLASHYRYSENYCAFRLKKTDGSVWTQEMPGAYFILQALIDGNWTGRPYAITDDGAESGLREVIVKRKNGGLFTNWLYEHLDSFATIPLRVSACMGGASFALNHHKPIICLIGGVGITPVLALCRLQAKNTFKPKICIDYSASGEEDFFCRDELAALAGYCDLQISFRETTKTGRIQQTDIDKLIQQYPDECFYICGPESYKVAVLKLLENTNVTPQHIIDLEAPVAQLPISPPGGLANESEWAYRVVGLLLLSGYVLQELWGWKISYLEQLQAQFYYKIFSGLLLFSYLLLQWRLPLVRWLNLSNDMLVTKKRSHKAFGAIAPLVFYLHASSVGVSYLLVLSTIYLTNSLIGFLNAELIADIYKKAYLFGWTVLHVGLSTSLLFLSGYHAYIALAYK